MIQHLVLLEDDMTEMRQPFVILRRASLRMTDQKSKDGGRYDKSKEVLVILLSGRTASPGVTLLLSLFL